MIGTTTRDLDEPEDTRVEPFTRADIAEIVTAMQERRKYRLKVLAMKFGCSIKTLYRIDQRASEEA